MAAAGIAAVVNVVKGVAVAVATAARSWGGSRPPGTVVAVAALDVWGWEVGRSIMAWAPWRRGWLAEWAGW